MKPNNVVMGAVAITLLYLFGCQAGGGGSATVAEQFMDRYYRQANVGEAKSVAIPTLAEKIEATLKSSAGVIPENNDGTRKVTYTLKENLLDGTGTHSSAIYETIIASKEGGSIRKRVHLSLDLVDGVWKIAEFNEGTF